jgi:glucuronate isomerase
MKTFIQEDFLLSNNFAKRLYHGYAKDLPIIDYHNHLPPKEIAENRVFENITKVWLAGDHYKWRALRALGIDENYITGNASDKEKFLKWAEAVPYTVRNPLYHWTHLELLRYFGIDDILSSENAEEVYQNTKEMLQQDSFSTLELLKNQKVETLCTTDDPTASLEYHIQLKNNSKGIKVLPTFRPDKAFSVENRKDYWDFIENLGSVTNITIESFDALLKALKNRIDFFHEHGCRLADHGLEQLYVFKEGDHNAQSIFLKLKEGESLSIEEIRFFKMKILVFLGQNYDEKGWIQQFHLGAIRDNNKRLLKKLGPDTGFDSIGDFSQARGLSGFLNLLDSTNQLPKTILYNNNPVFNEVFATMAGNFNDGTQKGKVQYGSAWWYMDQKDGMEKQINTLSNLGVLSTFVGMLTDSRSFLSFPRHEYFRRILCNLIGTDVANGQLPADEKWLGKIVSDICYYNARDYFKF